MTYRAENEAQASEPAKVTTDPTFIRRSVFAIDAKKERSNEAEVTLRKFAAMVKVASNRRFHYITTKLLRIQ